MATRAKQICLKPNCNSASKKRGGYCSVHAGNGLSSGANNAGPHGARRPSAAARGYGHKWRVLRRKFLLRNPLCVQCKERGLVVAATQVDHVVPHQGDATRFWNVSNLQSLCASCHSRKTRRQDSVRGGGSKSL